MPVITGWFDHELASRNSAARPRLLHDQVAGNTILDGPAFHIQLKSSCGTAHIADYTVTAVVGEPRDRHMHALRAADIAGLAVEGKADGKGESHWDELRGRFAVVHIDLVQSTATLVTDRFAVFPLCCLIEGPRIAFSDRADSVPHAGQREIDLQAIFNYVYFHVIPAPRTIFRRVQRIEPATKLSFDASGLHSSSTWQPTFMAKQDFDVDIESERFRTLLQQSIAREVTTSRVGAFLSGGTDSSTVVGLLGRITGEPVKSFSIGFEANGYDEISYARLTARHFNSELHEHYITPNELVRAIPLVAAHYDQPFGNSSALPAYYCAHLARDHQVEKLLAGDGGDELFGGNTRYARQRVFHAYYAVPASIRQRAIEPLLLQSKAARHLPGLKKLVRYVEQARLPMPERMETYNLLERFGAGAVFTPMFLASVNVSEPGALQREVYQRNVAHSIIDRMLAYDWRFTLADSDLPKIRFTAQLAGQTVGFPFLDDDLVDFSLSLPASMKVRGLTLRHFFKSALSDFLPVETLRKKKHGFGLPFGPWLIQDKALARFATMALEQLAERGFVRHELVHDLLSTRLTEHSGFYGEMVWVLMMLERWLERHAPTFKFE
jgi:asparagine synthase (glutamine-hydrolysing)